MKLHDLGPDEGAHKRRRRVARGNGGRGGTYAGRGRKGQNARPGGSKAAYFEGGQLPFVRRLPFKRGFKPIGGRVTLAAVNIESLEALFAPGAEVTPDTLVAAGLLRSADEPFKVLGQGDLTKRLAVHAPHFSAAARAAIEQAGGACHALDAAPRLIPRRRHTRWPRPHRVG